MRRLALALAASLLLAAPAAAAERRTVKRVAAGVTWTQIVRTGGPMRLNVLTMPLTWLPNTSAGRMLADYVSLTYAGGRPLAVWALASEPARSGRLSQAIFATRL